VCGSITTLDALTSPGDLPFRGSRHTPGTTEMPSKDSLETKTAQSGSTPGVIVLANNPIHP
jgi:hypothetical protein